MQNNDNTRSIEFLTTLPLDRCIESPDKKVLVLLSDVSKFEKDNKLRINVKTFCVNFGISLEIPTSYIKQIFDKNQSVFNTFNPSGQLDYVTEKKKDYSYDLVFQH